MGNVIGLFVTIKLIVCFSCSFIISVVNYRELGYVLELEL